MCGSMSQFCTIRILHQGKLIVIADIGLLSHRLPTLGSFNNVFNTSDYKGSNDRVIRE
jgi:hypothetical protein